MCPSGDFLNGIGVTAGDIDGDGDIDVIGAASYDDNLVWWENLDASGDYWLEHLISAGSEGACTAHATDIDGDGDTDVLCGCWYGSALDENLAWWENDDDTGTGWTMHMIDRNFHDLNSTCLADLNSDGLIDIVGSSNQLGSIRCWIKLDETGLYWEQCTVTADFYGACSVHSQDIDGDGDMDIAATGIYEAVMWFDNSDGTGTAWIEHPIDSLAVSAVSVHAMDVDCDGDQDILAASMNDSEVKWYENAPTVGWVQHIVDTGFDLACCLCSEDVDGDGDDDPIACGGGYATELDQRISWWNMDEYQASGGLESSILDTDCSPHWSAIDWSATEPAGTSLGFQVRSSDSPEITQMGPWSDTLYAPCSLQGILTDGEQYVQHRAVMETADPATTPTLLDVTLSWNPVGIDEASEPVDAGPSLLPVIPNPSSDQVCVRFITPGDIAVGLRVYDFSGRLVFEDTSEHPAGESSLQLDGLAPGVYFLRMEAGGELAGQRFVVVDQTGSHGPGAVEPRRCR